MIHPYDASLIAQRTKERKAELHERLTAKLEISRAMADIASKQFLDLTPEERVHIQEIVRVMNDEARQDISHKAAGDTETRDTPQNARTDEASAK